MKKWKERYKGMRAAMWGIANVNLVYESSGADLQNITYSMNYATCYVNDVFLQLCSWSGDEHLWPGASVQVILVIKNIPAYLKTNTSLHIRIQSIANISHLQVYLNKGYRVNLSAWWAGRHQFRQSTLPRSDRIFMTRETIHTSTVTMYWAGNECEINHKKQSSHIKKHLQRNVSQKLMDDVWLSLSFNKQLYV